MDEKLYDLCDWAEIEAIVYSEHDNPHSILGPHVTNDGILISTFIPTAVSITVQLNKSGKEYSMELFDEAGYFTVLVPGKRIVPYTYFVTYDNGSQEQIVDPYYFDPVIDAMDLKKFISGIHYDIYSKLGAHPMEIEGVQGVLFAVWAPNAMRVSVVGDFNLWDGRRHMMRRLGDSGVFELFIPGLKEGMLYKYEVKIRSDYIVLKADPYGYASELRPATASLVYDINKYEWKDQEWLTKRAGMNLKDLPMIIYEVHLGSWMKPVDGEGSNFYNYRYLAHLLAQYVKDMGYTHIELMPIMEHPLDESWGYQVTGYYAATSRYGTPEDFMYFVDYMHRNGIGVILDWVPAHFPRDVFGLANFDGTCLYEHRDPRQGAHPHWGTLIYNYGRPEVANFLISNALFWVEKFHADGIRMDAVASMLYLDYGKQDGGWVANMYGGNENLEAVEFLRNLSNVFRKRKDGAILIAEESTAWEKVTGDVKAGGLGFDFKWNMGWMNDFTNYMKCDPLFRKGHHGELTFSMIYAYSENFILVLSHDEVVHGKGSMINKMPGDYEEKFANLRSAYGYMMAHPGKKLIFMGQDIAQFDEWNENTDIQWDLLEYEKHSQMKDYVRSLNHLYKEYPAFYRMDFSNDGFEWINSMDADKSIISFLRKTDRKEETLLVVCNFTPVVYNNFRIGVPFKGKYKEAFNSDRGEFGGSGNINPRSKYSKEEECDGREDSILVTVPPLGISVFTCSPIATSGTKKKGSPAKNNVAKSTESKIAKSSSVKIRKGTVSKGNETIGNVDADAKNEVVAEGVEAKSRGRKKIEVVGTETIATIPKPRGRKKKEVVEPEPVKAEPKKRGRKKKEVAEPEPVKAEPKKRGRKKKEVMEPEPVKAEPKKRGRKKKEEVESVVDTNLEPKADAVEEAVGNDSEVAVSLEEAEVEEVVIDAAPLEESDIEEIVLTEPVIEATTLEKPALQESSLQESQDNTTYSIEEAVENKEKELQGNLDEGSDL